MKRREIALWTGLGAGLLVGGGVGIAVALSTPEPIDRDEYRAALQWCESTELEGGNSMPYTTCDLEDDRELVERYRGR